MMPFGVMDQAIPDHTAQQVRLHKNKEQQPDENDQKKT